MDDLRLGSTIRLLRRRRGWNQIDLAKISGCSAGVVSRLERGNLDAVSVRCLRRISAALEVRIDLVPRWRGGELDRLLNRRHAQMHEVVARHLTAQPGWSIRPEVSFSVFGERGVIDVLAWHAARSMVLVIELKTELVDVMDLMSTMDRRRRLAPRIAADLNWQARSVSTLVLLIDSRTNRRRLAEHRAVLRAAFPGDGRRLAGWFRNPAQPVDLLAMWPDSHQVKARPSSRTSRAQTGRDGTTSRPTARTSPVTFEASEPQIELSRVSNPAARSSGGDLAG